MSKLLYILLIILLEGYYDLYTKVAGGQWRPPIWALVGCCDLYYKGRGWVATTSGGGAGGTIFCFLTYYSFQQRRHTAMQKPAFCRRVKIGRMPADTLYGNGSIFYFPHTNGVCRKEKWALSTGSASPPLQPRRWVYEGGDERSPRSRVRRLRRRPPGGCMATLRALQALRWPSRGAVSPLAPAPPGGCRRLAWGNRPPPGTLSLTATGSFCVAR